MIPVPPSRREELTSPNKEQIGLAMDMLHEHRCFREVWTPAEKLDEAAEDLSANGRQSRDYARMTKNRAGKCFFYPYEQRMSLEAAAELERRETEHLEGKRDRQLTRRAFWVAFAALIASVCAALAGLVWDIWKYHHPR